MEAGLRKLRQQLRDERADREQLAGQLAAGGGARMAAWEGGGMRTWRWGASRVHCSYGGAC